MMMMQMPIVMVQRLPWVRKRTLLNNVLFWCSMILGLSLVSFFHFPPVQSCFGWSLVTFTN
jgi:sterol O-acyltransferase